MGSVYEAFHDAIQRRVAVKLLHPDFARDAQFVARFFNEARAVNLIGHPGLIQISDLGQLPDGSAYLVMELLRGESLERRMAQSGNKLPLADVLQFSWQIADALAEAHAKGIVHRDLKPQNVMLVADAQVAIGERIKLLDFGLAKVSEDAGGAHVKTKTHAVMGTPLYMSPEQCEGAGGIDGKSDVYSLFVMMYEMLSGTPPFVAEGHGRILFMHMSVAPEPLRSRAPSVPKPVAELVHKLLAKTREERPTMRQVATQLEALLPLAPPVKRVPAGQPQESPGGAPPVSGTSATLPGPGQTASPGRRPPLVVLLGALALAGLAIVMLVLRLTRHPASVAAVPPVPPPGSTAPAAPPIAPPPPEAAVAAAPTEPAAPAKQSDAGGLAGKRRGKGGRHGAVAVKPTEPARPAESARPQPPTAAPTPRTKNDRPIED